MAGTSIGGKKAYQYGKWFEDHFELISRMRGATVRRGYVAGLWAGKRLIPIKKEKARSVDFNLIFNSISVYVDTKTFDSDRITRTNLEEHQLAALDESARAGCTSGYVIYFRPTNAICFCEIKDLMKLWSGGVKNILAKDMKLLGTYEDFYIGRLFSMHWENQWTYQTRP